MKTNRGFEIIKFQDDYGEDCSLQESSSSEPHIWLGIDHPKAVIMYKDAVEAGLDLGSIRFEQEGCGWGEILIPAKAHIFGRMHLNRKQARTLAKRLNFFALHGYLQEEENKRGKANDKNN